MKAPVPEQFEGSLARQLFELIDESSVGADLVREVFIAELGASNRRVEKLGRAVDYGMVAQVRRLGSGDCTS